MEPITILGLAALFGYAIFHENDEDRALREKRMAEAEREFEESKRKEKALRELHEAERRKKEKPFSSTIECFTNQYVSYSRISTYCSCPRRFKLIYLDKVRIDRDERRYTKGTVFHSAVEKCMRGYIGQIIPRVKSGLITSEAYRLGYLEYNRGRWTAKQRALLERRREKFKAGAKFLCNTFPQDAEVVAVEQELSFYMNGMKYYGIVDLVLKYPDGHYEIVDYKTGMKLPIKEQLEIYSLPFLRIDSAPRISYRIICVDRKCHYLWETEKTGLVATANRITGIVNEIIEDTTFTGIEGPKCKGCSVRERCDVTYHFSSIPSSRYMPSQLTKLSKFYEWKPGGSLPKSLTNPDTTVISSPNKRSLKKGASFKLVKASRDYKCLHTGYIINNGEYHFANRHGKRYCKDAFLKLFPERAEQLLNEVKNIPDMKSKPSAIVIEKNVESEILCMCPSCGSVIIWQEGKCRLCGAEWLPE